MAIADYNTPLYTKWYTNSNGEKISIMRENISYIIIKNKVILSEVPDEYYKVSIDNYVEKPLGTKITDTQFTVDYSNGEITFTSSQNGKTINVARYYGRGIIYIFGSRVIAEFDETNNNIISTFSDIFYQINQFAGKGEYSDLVSYEKFNIVNYAGSSYICLQPCIGIAPSNSVYWQRLVSPSLELNYRGVYDNTLAYTLKDAVSYGGSVYYCIQPTTGNIPTNLSYWTLFLSGSSGALLKNQVTITEDLNVVNIGITDYDYQKDFLMVYVNTTYVEENDSTVGYTITDNGTTITKTSGTWLAGTTFNFVVYTSTSNLDIIQGHINSLIAHPAQNITYSGQVTGATQVKQAIDNIQQQVNSITTTPNDGNVEITQARTDINNVTHASLKTRLDTWEKKKVFFIEEKTVLKGANSFTLTNTFQSAYMTLEIRDKKYGAFWEKTLHYTISGQIVTLTESALTEDLTFVIKAI